MSSMLRQHISEKSFIINDNSAWKYIKYNIYEQKQYLSKTKFGYTVNIHAVLL